MRITTKTGCTVRTLPLGLIYPHMGEGVLFVARMEQPGDGRMFEVAFTTEEWQAVSQGPVTADEEKPDAHN